MSRNTHKSNSLKGILLHKLRVEYPNWVHSGELQKYAVEHGYLGSTCARDLRRLREEGWITDRTVGKSRSNEYKYLKRTVTVNDNGSVTIQNV